MRRIATGIVAVMLASACSAPHAMRVRCDGQLVPINLPVTPRAPLASAAGEEGAKP